MIDATWSVGLPSLSAASHVPASFFIFSRPALVGGGGSLSPGLSPPKLATRKGQQQPAQYESSHHFRFSSKRDRVDTFVETDDLTPLFSRTTIARIDRKARNF